MAPSFHSLRHQGAMAEAEGSRQEQDRKSLAPLKVVSIVFYATFSATIGRDRTQRAI